MQEISRKIILDLTSWFRAKLENRLDPTLSLEENLQLLFAEPLDEPGEGHYFEKPLIPESQTIDIYKIG